MKERKKERKKERTKERRNKRKRRKERKKERRKERKKERKKKRKDLSFFDSECHTCNLVFPHQVHIRNSSSVDGFIRSDFSITKE